MAELLAQLVPEILGLAATPAAIVACLLLLGSHRPYRNVAIFGGTVLALYSVLGAVAIAAGRSVDAHEAGEATTVRDWIGLVVGLLFLVGGIIAIVRRPPPRPAGASEQLPPWARKLASPEPATLVGVAVVLALVNPNVAIFFSGVGSVVAADVPVGAQAVGVLVLVLASVLDYVLPTVFYAVTGLPGRHRLHAMRSWLVRHDRAVGAAVLLVFGTMFTVRGLVRLGG
ncbi:GAP family protein [Promicromonospora iranensis]|uniref:GAP family protein n=1 Tax=Promicromonospora iranensis TaxID=1105144 RepID=UPI0023AA12D9|nr:GAP family protein [Promicromonospora iranensis]